MVEVKNANDKNTSGDEQSRDDFDLEERTARFGEDAIRFARSLPTDVVTEPLIRQFVRSATSVGANYCEANDAESRKDFRHKIGLCRKESKESKHWLRMIAVAAPGHRDAAALLWREAKELNLIFSKIFQKVATT
jgi:four helix bundle protein